MKPFLEVKDIKEDLYNISSLLYYDSIPNDIKRSVLIVLQKVHVSDIDFKSDFESMSKTYNFPDDIEEIQKITWVNLKISDINRV